MAEGWEEGGLNTAEEGVATEARVAGGGGGEAEGVGGGREGEGNLAPNSTITACAVVGRYSGRSWRSEGGSRQAEKTSRFLRSQFARSRGLPLPSERHGALSRCVFIPGGCLVAQHARQWGVPFRVLSGCSVVVLAALSGLDSDFGSQQFSAILHLVTTLRH